MKRDLDLIVKMLMAVEAQPPSWDESELPILVQGSIEDRLLLQFHLDLLIDAGFVTCSMPARVRMGMGLRLTWSGCEFLDTFRPEDVRAKVAKLAKAVGGMSLTAIQTAVTDEGVEVIKKLYASLKAGIDQI